MAEKLDSPVDRPGSVRRDEALDTAALAPFVARALFPQGSPPSGADVPLEVQQFRGGHSNLTYLVRLGDREAILRRPPFGTQVKTAHDMRREFTILSALEKVYGKVPHPIAFCDDENVIGAQFYLMERVSGVILRGQAPPPGIDLGPDLMRALSTALVDDLAALHEVDVHATGLISLGRPEGYVERQVRGWTERYFRAKTDEIPEVERAAAWCGAHLPTESGASIVHNDFKYDNLILDPRDLTRVVAVLDWEMATIGDPLMDLGTTLGYWVDPDDVDELKMLPIGPTHLPGNLSRAQLVERYAARTGGDVGGILFHYVFALFKIAVIAQQIYKRFKDGKTRDPRFEMMIVGVRILGAQAARALDAGRIDRLG